MVGLKIQAFATGLRRGSETRWEFHLFIPITCCFIAMAISMRIFPRTKKRLIIIMPKVGFLREVQAIYIKWPSGLSLMMIIQGLVPRELRSILSRVEASINWRAID